MKSKSITLVSITLLLFLLTACGEEKAESIVKSKATSSAVTSSIANNSRVTDAWLGQWNGPEGTFIKLTGGYGKYEVVIHNLDGPQSYNGTSVNNEIQFERNGVVETIHATNGSETGMKWLSEKSNCLTINPGEGFCRD